MHSLLLLTCGVLPYLLASFGVLQHLLAPRYLPFSSFLSIPCPLFAVSFFSCSLLPQVPPQLLPELSSHHLIHQLHQCPRPGWPRSRQKLPPPSFLTSVRCFCCAVRRQNLRIHSAAESALCVCVVGLRHEVDCTVVLCV